MRRNLASLSLSRTRCRALAGSSHAAGFMEDGQSPPGISPGCHTAPVVTNSQLLPASSTMSDTGRPQAELQPMAAQAD